MSALPSRTAIEAEQLRRSFRRFVEAAWPLLEPTSPFIPGYHIDAVCDSLEAVIAGELRRVLVTLPPRHAKSSLACVLWPAWAWISRPELRWLFASYAQSLATRDSRRCRQLIESSWYQERWGHVYQLLPDQNEKDRFENTRTGARLATSVGGSATGEGGDIIVIDDAHKIEEAHSPAARESVIDWFTGTISTRLNNPREGAILVIGQRLHERDLPGHLIELGTYFHLCLPAEFEQAHPHRWAGDPRTEEGELLCPQRFGPEQLEALKISLGPYGAAAQLQQRPAPADGAIFSRQDWRFYDPNRIGAFDQVVQSWDTTFDSGPSSDFCVGQAWGTIGPNKYLIREVRGQWNFTQAVEALIELTDWINQTYPRPYAHPILIEKTANGPAIITALRERLPSIFPITPTGNKISRANATAIQAAAGNIWLSGTPVDTGLGYDRSKTPQWVQNFIHEAETFPSGSNDDRVDAMSQAILWLSKPGPRCRALIGR